MKSNLPVSRTTLLASLSLLLVLILTAATGLVPAAEDGVHLSADAGYQLRTVWERARETGSYDFTVDLTTRAIPKATVRNVGQTSVDSRYYLEGSTSIPDESLEIMLWSSGGSALLSDTGIQIRTEGSQAWARQGEGEWTEIQNFTGGFAPNGDFLAMVEAAANVQSEVRQVPGGGEFTVFIFDVDGAAYAEAMRLRMEEELRSAGQLPPGIHLENASIYAEMTGSGELWLAPDGLPARQVMHLVFPETDDGRTEALLTVDFSGFGEAAHDGRTAGGGFDLQQVNWAGLVAALRSGLDEPLPVLAVAAALLVLVALVRSRRRKELIHRLIVSTYLAAVLLTPLVNIRTSTAFAAGQAEREAREAVTDEAAARDEAFQTFLDTSQNLDWPVNTNPVEAAYTAAVDSARIRTLAADLGLNAPPTGEQAPGSDLVYISIDAQGRPQFSIPDNGTDTDGDGLTDTEEVLLGTSSSTTDNNEDGIADGQDTDNDLINDRLEVEGFSYSGQDWYLDPRELDTNGDTYPDTVECSVTDETLDCPDTDGDGTPDAFDDDNDGDGIPDNLDLSPFKSYDTLFKKDSPLELTIDGLQQGSFAYVEFQIQPEDPDHLWYAFNVLDWPEDELGQIQEHESGEDAVTFYTLCLEGLDPGVDPADACDMARDTNGDVKFVPLLEIVLPDDSHVPDQQTLDNYGIIVQPTNSGSSEQVAYLPLTLTTDSNGDRHVAFYGKMVYEVGGDAWGAAHEVRLVWAVQMLVDNVCTDDDNGDCLTYEDNVLQIIHSYYDNFHLAGMNVREDFGAEMAMIYEDPGAETPDEWDNDGNLIALANGLDSAFLTPRDCDLVTSQGDCISDGERDINITEIYNRFNHATNGGYDEVARWGTDNIFTVKAFSYDHIDEAAFAMAQTETPAVLDGVFTPVWTPANQISPSILYAREERYRALNLNVAGLDDSVAANGNTVAVDFEAGEENPVLILDAFSIAPFRYDDAAGIWSDYPMDEYLEVLEQRYEAEAAIEDDDPWVQAGLVLGAQLYYLTLNNGLAEVTGTTNFDATVDVFYEPGFTISDESLADEISGFGGIGAKATVFVVNVAVFSKIAGSTQLISYFSELSFAMAEAGAGRTLRSFTIDDTLHSVYNKLKNLISGEGFDRIVGGVAALTIALFIIGGILLLAGLPHEAQFAGAVLLAVASSIAFVVAPIFGLISAIRGFKELGAGASNIVMLFLKGSSDLVGQSRVASVVGLVLQVAIVWGVFAYLALTGQIEPGSIEFNTALAFTIGATILAIIFFVLSLTAIGFIIVAIIGVIDLIFSLFCLANDKDECFSISGEITEFLADLLYTVDSTVDLEIETKSGDPALLIWTGFNQTLTDESLGMQWGNSMVFSADITVNLYNKPPENIGAVNTSIISESEIKRSTFEHSLEGHYLEPAATSLGKQKDSWTVEKWDLDPDTPDVDEKMQYTFYVPWKVNKELQLYHAYRFDTLTSSPFLLLEGINNQMNVYYHLSYAVPGYDCWVEICDSRTITGTSVTDLSDELVFDVFPNTLEGMYAWDWDGLLYQEYEGTTYYALDHDGDGLMTNLLPDGNDPNDSLTDCNGGLCWDTDGDGLSDGYEMAYREAGYENGGGAINPLNPDTDGDLLLDSEETKIGADPTRKDTDGDGLTDKEEVDGWLFTYAPGKQTHVTSDPLIADTDGDGLSDKLEKTLHETDPAAFQYHPRVENPNPLELSAETDIPQGYYMPGETVAYTLTVRNDFDSDIYIKGNAGLSASVISNQGPGSVNFNLFTGSTRQLVTSYAIPGGASSQETEILANAQGTLTTAQGQILPGTLNASITSTVTIDADEPTSTLVTSPYVMSGGVRIIGGTASDPTSYVQAVQVKVGSGPWQPATGADQWAFALNVPATAGTLAVSVRAIDAVGNIQSVPTVVNIMVDDAPPSAAPDGVFLGNPFVTAKRNSDDTWSIPLYGTASDSAAGVETVEIKLDPDGYGWQAAAYDDNAGTWSIDYALSSFSSSNAPIFEATGQYTVSMRATDLALDTGNVFTDTIDIRLDNTAPVVSLDPIGQDSVPQGTTTDNQPLNIVLDEAPISSDLTLTGVVTDTGSVGVGVDGMEIAFMPLEAVQAISNQDAYFPLDEPPGAEVFANFADPANDGICALGQCPTMNAPGRFGTAAQFSAASQQYIDVPNLDVNETGYAASLWFKTTCDNCGLFSADDGVLGNLGSDRELYLVSGNVCSYVEGAGTDICSVGVDYADGQWHMVADVIGPSGHQLYVDGELAAQDSLTASGLLTQDGINLGFATRAGSQYLTGSLDEVQVLGQEIDAATVRSLYQSWIAFDPDSPGALSSTWSYPIPYGLEGLYQIDLLATDLLQNRNDDRSSWNHWRGEIDSLEPRLSIQLTYEGNGSTAKTNYQIHVEDANLSLDRFAGPCLIGAGDQTFDEDGQLIALDISCSVDGWETAPTYVRACDTLGQCAAAYPEQAYLYSTTDTSVSRIPMAGNSTTDDMRQVLVSTDRAHGIVVDVENGYVYWAEFGPGTNTGAIRRADLDGSNVVDIITGIPAPPVDNSITTRPVLHIGLAVDLGANKLYWTETETGLVKRANLDGTGVETIVNVWGALGSQPILGHITIDTVNNRLYWGQGRNNSGYSLEIWGSATDGTDLQEVIPDGTFIDGIVADPVSGKLYWNETSTAENGVIWMSDLDGSNATELVIGNRGQGETEFHALAITPDSQKLIYNAGPYTEQVPGTGTTNTFIYIMQHLRSVQVTGTGDGYLFPTYIPITSCLESACPIATAAVGGGGQNGLSVGLVPNTSITTTDLELSVTSNTDLALPGATLFYTFTVENKGPLDAYDTTLNFSLPAHVSVTDDAGCSSGAGKLTCDLGNLLEGSMGDVTFELTVDGSPTGRLEGLASVATSIGDDLLPNNSVDTRAFSAQPAPVPVSGSTLTLYIADQTNGTLSDIIDEDNNILVDSALAGEVGDIVVDETRGRIYWSDRAGGAILQADLDGLNVVTLKSGLSFPDGLALDPNDAFLYIGETGQISRLDLDTLALAVIQTVSSSVSELEYDPIRDHLFWRSGSSVYKLDLIDNEGPVEVLAGLSQVSTIAIDPYRGRIYWNKNNYYGEIWQAGMDGTNAKKIDDPGKTPDIFWYDLLADNIYFFEYISFSTVNEYILSNKQLTPGGAILANGFEDPQAVTGRYILPPPEAPTITSSPGTTATTGQPYSYQAGATGDAPITWSLISPPAGMVISSTTGLVQWTPAAAGPYNIQVQATNNTGSDTQSYNLDVANPPAPTIISMPVLQVEFGMNYAYQAEATGTGTISWSLGTAPAGMTISASGLVEWMPGAAGVYDVEVEATNLGGTTVQAFQINVYAFDAGNQLYWVINDVVPDAIQRTDLSILDANPTITATVNTIYQITIDQLNGVLYYTDGDEAIVAGFPFQIWTSGMDGSNPVMLIDDTDPNLVSAYGIAVDPFNGFLYWTDPAAGQLGRSNLDGSGSAVLASGLTSPKSIEIDISAGRLYWLDSDGVSDILMSANTDGSDVQTVQQLNQVRDFILDSEAGWIFLAGGNTNSVAIRRGDYSPTGVSNPTVLVSGLEQVNGIYLDHDTGTLYWTVNPADEIWSCSIALCVPSQLVIANQGTAPADIRGRHAYWQDLAGPQLSIESVVDNQIIPGYDPVTISGTVTATAYLKSLTIQELIGGVWTPIYVENWLEGEATTAAWSYDWTTPTAGYTSVGTHELQVELVDWGDRVDEVTDLTLEIQPPPSNFTLPPDLAPLHVEITSPANGATFTGFDPITFTFGAAAEQYLNLVTMYDLTYLDDNITFDDYSWGEAVEMQGSVVWTPPVWPETRDYVFTLTGEDYNLLSEVITFTLTIVVPPGNDTEPIGYVPPVLDAVIDAPLDGTVLTSLDPITVEGSAFATDDLATLEVTVDGSPIYSDSWGAGVTTDEAWSTSWAPPSDGVYVLDTVITDWAGRTLTETHPVTLTVQTVLPSVTNSTNLLTQADQISNIAVVMTGTVDAVPGSLVEVNIDSAGFQPAIVNGASWSYEWVVDEDGVLHPVRVRVTDPAGRRSSTLGPVLVDTVAPDPVSITLYAGANVIQPGDTVYASAETLTIEWTAGSDGSGMGAYLAGWQETEIPDIGSLTVHNDLQHSELIPERRSLYAHLVVQDIHGNQTFQVVGPVYIDAPEAYDLVEPLEYHGWENSGGTLIGTSTAISETAPVGTSPSGIQQFYMTWDDDQLRFAWDGASWNADGDLFIYFDTTGGSGAGSLFNPYGDGVEIAFPVEGGVPFGGDYVLVVEDGGDAVLYAWDGSDWVSIQVLTPAEFQLVNTHTDILIPFSWLGLDPSQPLNVLAVASEEDALALWAAMPDKNPLNSIQVISPLATNPLPSDFALTQYYSWPNLNDGTTPNAGQFSAGDLHLSITADQPAVAAAYLAGGLFDLLTPESRLDADLDGVLDIPLPYAQDPAPLGTGAVVSYVVNYANTGTETVPAVTLDLSAYGAVQPGSSQVVIGDVPAGASGSVQVQATINSALDGESGELVIELSDGVHGPYDWFWFQHDIDSAVPVNVTIDAPTGYARTGVRTVSGQVVDVSPIDHINLSVRSQPGGAVDTVVCPDGDTSGTWSCDYDFGDLAGLDSLDIRAQAVDIWGGTSAWTDWSTLLVDLTKPSVALDPSVDAAIADGFMGPGEFFINGTVDDDEQVKRVKICLVDESLNCFNSLVTPPGSSSGSWGVDVGIWQSGDGITQTLNVVGYDAAGNVSEPVTRSYRIDTVAPVITVTSVTTTTVIGDANASPDDLSIDLSGTVTDGGEVESVVVRTEINGVVSFFEADLNGEDWSFSMTFTTSGDYTFTVEATDVAGNMASSQSYETSFEASVYTVWLPVVFNDSGDSRAQSKSGLIPGKP